MNATRKKERLAVAVTYSSYAPITPAGPLLVLVLVHRLSKLSEPLICFSLAVAGGWVGTDNGMDNNI